MSRIILATVWALWIAVFGPLAQGQRTEGELADLFAKAAATVFERAKGATSPDSAALLRDFMGEGANRLVSDKKTSDREISASVDLMKRFANEMVKQGARQPAGRLLLSEASFAAAQRSVCPLYPFC